MIGKIKFYRKYPYLAKLLVDMAKTGKYGIYHAHNEGTCSWAEFARSIFPLVDMKVQVIGISSCDYPTKVIRPLNSRLDSSNIEKNGFSLLPSWQEALKWYIDGIGVTVIKQELIWCEI